ncbi:hypothetical protein BGX28_000617 [Mortierella sp. GBA30]|nr:hypothetical protein BGX28_000617 [Mortierella sp. GBA30]
MKLQIFTLVAAVAIASLAVTEAYTTCSVEQSEQAAVDCNRMCVDAAAMCYSKCVSHGGKAHICHTDCAQEIATCKKEYCTSNVSQFLEDVGAKSINIHC